MVGLSTAGVSPADASRNCGAVWGAGPSAGVRVTAAVTKGAISCRVAREVARALFSSEAKENNSCGFSYCSYKTVSVYGRVWRGDTQMGGWVMHRCRQLLGCKLVLRGSFRTTRSSVAHSTAAFSADRQQCRDVFILTPDGTIYTRTNSLRSAGVGCRKARKVARAYLRGVEGIERPPSTFSGFRCQQRVPYSAGIGCRRGSERVAWSW